MWKVVVSARAFFDHLYVYIFIVVCAVDTKVLTELML